MLRVVLLWTLTAAVVSSTPCCPEGLWVITPRLCSDNVTNLNINCGNRSAFILDPMRHDDNFTLPDPGDDLIYGSQHHHIKHGTFCVARIQRRRDIIPTEHEIAVVCFPDPHQSTDVGYHSSVLMTLFVISILFLLLTLIVYLLIPELRDLRGKILMVYISSLCIGYMLLCLGHVMYYVNTVGCTIIAHMIYFSLLSTFSWMNVVSFDVWRAVKLQGRYQQSTPTLLYLVWGIGVPAIMNIIPLIIDNIPGQHIKSSIGITKCWFSEYTQSWIFFNGPTTVMIMINIVLFVAAAVKLRSGLKHQPVRFRCLKYRCLLYLKLFLIMGVMWIFENISFAFQSVTLYNLWHITDTINALQGAIIFFLLVPFRQRVRRGLVTNKVLRIPWPREWMTQSDEESETMIPEDELEMSK